MGSCGQQVADPFVKVTILQLLLMIWWWAILVIFDKPLFTFKNNFHLMVGAMIGRLEISSFEVIGTIRGGNFFKLLCCWIPFHLHSITFIWCFVPSLPSPCQPTKQRVFSYIYFGMQDRANNFASIRHMHIPQKWKWRHLSSLINTMIDSIHP